MTPSIASDNLSTRSQRTNETIKDVKNDVRDGASNVKADLNETANKVGGKVRDLMDSASEEFSAATKVVSSHITEKPVQSALIALGVGYILGKLFR